MLTIDDPKTFDWKNISLVDCSEGNCKDTYFTLKLYYKFEEMLQDTERWKLYEKLISPISDPFLEMEYNGQEVSSEIVSEIGNKIYQDKVDQEDILSELPEIKGKGYNLNSSKDQISVLFLDEEGFGLYPPKFTDGENPLKAFL